MVYPRTGGGNHKSLCPNQVQPGSIPARAGETIGYRRMRPVLTVYPRTGGGNYIQNGGHPVSLGLSPHGRGKRWRLRVGSGRVRSIPARAGETRMLTPNPNGFEVYPRTGGGNPQTSFLSAVSSGLSPHGRGKPSHF